MSTVYNSIDNKKLLFFYNIKSIKHPFTASIVENHIICKKQKNKLGHHHVISMVFTPTSRAISMRVISQLLYNNYNHNYNKILTSDWPSAVLISAPVNLQNRTGEERRQHTLWDKRYNNFVLQNFSPNFTLF